MIKENITKVKERISYICSKINQDPNRITIVAVSKGRTPQQIKEVIAAGIIDIGENRVQEAIIKYNEPRPPKILAGPPYVVAETTNHEPRPIKWHLVGHLQTNKVKEAVKIFDLIQSVDSIYLAQEIDKQAARINKIQDILIQVNTSAEATKFGLKPLRRPDLVRGIKHFVAYLLLRTASLKDAVLGLSNCVGENVRVHCESWVNCMVKSGRFVSHWELR